MRQTQDMAEELGVKAVNPAMANFNPVQMDRMWPTVPAEMLEAFLGPPVQPPRGLEAKTRLLLTRAGPHDTRARWPRRRSGLTVRHAIEAGATKQEIAETHRPCRNVSAVLPAMNKAMELAAEVFDGGVGES